MRRPNEEEEDEQAEEGKGDDLAPLLPPEVPISLLPLASLEGGIGLGGRRRLPLSSSSLAIDSSVSNHLRRTSLSPASSRYSFMQVSRGE